MEVFCWFDFILFIAICKLFSYDVDGMDCFESTRVLRTISFGMLSLEQLLTNNKVLSYHKTIRSLGNFKLFHFA